MPGPIMTVEKAYRKYKGYITRRKLRKTGIYVYYIRLTSGRRVAVHGRTKVWHRGNGVFSVYKGNHDRKVVAFYNYSKRGYGHTGDGFVPSPTKRRGKRSKR